MFNRLFALGLIFAFLLVPSTFARSHSGRRSHGSHRSSSSARKSVHVRGYTKKNGTVVKPYNRHPPSSPSPITHPVPKSRSDTLITMVKAAEFCDFDDRSMLHNRTLDGALLLESKMRT
jgi:hypothetical protein